MGDVTGKSILVTGGTSGLGADMARMFGSRGAKVAITGRRKDRGKAVVEEINNAGGEGFFLHNDIMDGESVDQVVGAVVERFGRLDGAVNNAGVSGAPFTRFADMTDEVWDAVIATNLTGVWRCMRAEIRAMLKTGGGSIVNISSIYGLVGSDVGHADYAASKHGVIGLTKSAAIDYAKENIRTNAICPGYCHSEMVDPVVEQQPELTTPIIARHSAMNRLGHGHEIAETAVWLLSDASSFVNGAAIPVEGGPSQRLF